MAQCVAGAAGAFGVSSSCGTSAEPASANWYIRRLLYGHIARGGVLVVPCAQHCSFYMRCCDDGSAVGSSATYYRPAGIHHTADAADRHRSPFIDVRLVGVISGEEAWRAHVWCSLLAGDIVSKANASHLHKHASNHSCQYVLFDRSHGRTSLIQLLPLGEDVLTLQVLKVPYAFMVDAAASHAYDDPIACPLWDPLWDVEL